MEANFLMVNEACAWDTLQFIEFSEKVPDEVFWDFGDNSTSSESNPIHIFADFGEYIITMTVSYEDCYNKTAQKTISILECNSLSDSRIDLNGESKIHYEIYPIPSSGFITIEFSKDEIAEIQLAIYDLRGNIVHIERYEEQLEILEQLDLTGLEEGIYFMKIWMDNEVFVKRFLITSE
ncbi:MAG: T9SS type A sorting domain-containing protein [Cytophagales bacterium]|nr:T9SS type A sorting domain-containing protein [Cytophagales bacterium]